MKDSPMTDGHAKTDSNELVTHLKALTTALTAVHGDLYWLAMQAPNAEDKPAAPAADLNVTLLTELKNAVDDMRLLLFQYIETATEVNPQRVQEGMDAERLHRVTRFLQLLRGRLVHAPQGADQPMSFIERINAAVSQRLGGGGGEKAA
ncbi:MAG TPA: hypothetical protein VGK22_14825 [Candidatus Angelobacter sp.]